MMFRYIFTSPGNSFGVLFLILLYLSGLVTENSYGMALAATEDIENLITSSGLTLDEDNLFREMINGIAVNKKKTWYSEDFSPDKHQESQDLKEVLQILSLAKSSMAVLEMVNARIGKIVYDKKTAQSKWGVEEDIKEMFYRISFNSRYLVLDIEKHDCLKISGVTVPRVLTNISNSVWFNYSDSVFVPFKCPAISDYDRIKKLKELQQLKARTKVTARSKREVKQGNVTDSDSEVNIVQVNLTITNEVFEQTLLNINSGPYNDLVSRLSHMIDDIFNTTSEYKVVNDFSFRLGSVIASFHLEFGGPNVSVANVGQMFKNKIVNGSLGSFTVNTSLLNVGNVVNDNGMYLAWQSWSPCSKTCGDGQQNRWRSCNSTAPLACAHKGRSEETKTCNEKYCSDGCRKVLTGDRGNISFLEVNGKYPANVDCVWQIEVDKNHTIVVEFTNFDLEEDKKCFYDHVAFYDGSYPFSYIQKKFSYKLHPENLLMRFCGNGTPPRSVPSYGYPVNSTDSGLTVHFKTDATKERTGFTAIWYKVLKLHLRTKLIPQAVTTLSLISNPWSTTKKAAIPMGKGTTCPESFGEKDCYFFGDQTVISRITAIFLNRELINNSSDPILIKFEHILDEDIFPDAYTGRKTCVTWDHSITSPRYGAWTRRGCFSSFGNLTHTFCKCMHTGIFAVLGETKVPPKDLTLKANSYFGVAVSLLFVIITIYSLSTKSNTNTGELFHLFETLVSGVLLVIFLTGAHVPAEKELCGFLAFSLYYLVLSQFMWMLLTAVWIQNLLKRFLSERVKINIVYFAMGWGMPLVLAGVAGKVDIDQHGNKDNVCWVSLAGTGGVWGYGAPVFVMLMINFTIFVVLLMPSSKQKYDYDKMRPRILKEMVVMFFFLMTWIFGVQVVLDDSFKNQYFFCIFLMLQGAVNYNASFETTEQFWKDEVKVEKQDEKEESVVDSQEVVVEENKEENKTNDQSRMTVKTLKNLNIYKENGVFVIEA